MFNLRVLLFFFSLRFLLVSHRSNNAVFHLMSWYQCLYHIRAQKKNPILDFFLQHHKWAAVSDTTGSFAMKCSTDVHGLQKMNPYDVVL